MANVICIIPARLESTRLKEKLLLKIGNRSILQRVYEKAEKVKSFKKVYIATDSKKIIQEAKTFKADIILTGKCNSGTDRVYKACLKIKHKGWVVNLQADEPLIKISTLNKLVNDTLKAEYSVSTLITKADEEEYNDPNSVKCVIKKNRTALYFSRSPIPYFRDTKEKKIYKHIGVYMYNVAILKKFIKLKPSYLEEREKLEQLRFLEDNIDIYTVKTGDNPISVDTREDFLLVKKRILSNEKNQIR